jgi:hypothetical protein
LVGINKIGESRQGLTTIWQEEKENEKRRKKDDVKNLTTSF